MTHGIVCNDMKIRIFPAYNGDCIIIEHKTNHFILIDGGYANTYHKYLFPFLSEVAQNGGILDLVVVTHIDADHISGIIKHLEEYPSLIPIKNIWYNGYRHIQSIVVTNENHEDIIHNNIVKDVCDLEPKQVSAKQGCTLSSLIQRSGYSWNEQFKGNAVLGPAIKEVDDIKLYLLSPTSAELKGLCKYWKKDLIKKRLLSKTHSSEFWDDAYEFAMANEKPGFHFHTKPIGSTTNLEKIKLRTYIPDASITNGSSISFIIEYNNKRLLFLGDSYAETNYNSLHTLFSKDSFPLQFDAIKLSHHGSFNNNSPVLLKDVDSNNWIISTNGDAYNHPDVETLAHIITKGGSTCRSLIFNYDLAIGHEIDIMENHKKYLFELITNGEEIPISIKL